MYQQYPYQAQPGCDLTGEHYRNLRRHGVFVGGCLLGYFALQEILAGLMAFLGFSDDYQTNPAFQYAVAAFIFSFIALGLPFALYSRKKGSPSYFKVLPFHTPQPRKKIVCLVLAGWGACLASNFVAGYISSFFSILGFEENLPEALTSATGLDTFMNFLCAAVMAPLVEEFVFRGVIMQPLRRYGDSFAVITTAVIFALVHGSPSNIIFAFLSGTAIGYAVIYSKSLWAGIAIHALNNATAVFFTEFDLLPTETVDMLFVLFCVAVAVAGIIAFTVYGRAYTLRLNREHCGLKLGKRIKAVFLNVPAVAAFVYLLVLIFTSIL